MQVTLRSDDSPDVLIVSGNEVCSVSRLDQHIRTLQIARRWLLKERAVKAQREKQNRQAQK